MGHYMGPDADPADPRLSPLTRRATCRAWPPPWWSPPASTRWSTRARPTPGAWSRLACRRAYRCYDSLAHGFTAFTGAVPAADAACREIARLVRAAFDQAKV